MANDRYERDRRHEGNGDHRGDWPYSDDEMGGRFGDNRRGSSWGGAGGPGFYASERYGQAYRGASSEGRYGDSWGGRSREPMSGGGRYGYEEWNDRSGDRYGSGSSYGGSGYGGSRYGGGGGYGDDYGSGSIPGSSYGSSGGYGRSYGGSNYGSGRSAGGGYGHSSYGGERHGSSGHRGFMDKAGDEIASWFGDEDAERRREADHRGKGPRGYQRSDSRIEEDVNDRLTDDPMLDASEIDVSVSQCEVTLSGTVPSRQAKRRAEDCADAVSGVRHVQNNLRVQESGTSSTSSNTSTTI
jgi:osmotically-inducible protein OsmY